MHFLEKVQIHVHVDAVNEKIWYHEIPNFLIPHGTGMLKIIKFDIYERISCERKGESK